MKELKRYSFTYLEGGYSEVMAEDIHNASIEAQKHVKKHNINKNINWGSVKRGGILNK